jgi:glycosyltransferase involved in cell wall biosynthesis
MSSPTVTVLMPCRDAAATVAQAADSILAQRNVKLSLLAVDDGSRDETLQVLKDLSRTDRRLTVVPQDRLGLVPALNRGLSEVSTPWIARQDADDVSHPMRLADQLDLLARQPHLDVIGCQIRGFPKGSMTDGMRRYQEWQNALLTHDQMKGELFVESPLAHASALMRTDSIRQAGGYREFDGPEDWDLWARMLARGHVFGKAPRVRYFWREHENRATRRDPRMTPDKFRALKCRYLVSGPLAGRDSVELWSYGDQGDAWHAELKKVLPRIVYRPLNPKAVMSGKTGLPPLPSGNDDILLVAFGVPRIREWFKNELARRAARDGGVFLMIG